MSLRAVRSSGVAGSLAALMFGIGACSSPPPVDVIAADGALCDISRRLAGADLRISCLLSPDDDPHQLQLSPRQSRELRQASLVLINGYGLTPALDRLPGTVKVAELAVPHTPRLDAGAAAPPPSHQHQDHPGLAHSEVLHGSSDSPEPRGHDHSGRDPHVWHDPRQAIAMVQLVSERLQRLNPRHAATIRSRGQRMQGVLAGLHRWNQRQFASLPGRPTLASGHRAYASLARAYDLDELAVLDADSASNSLRPQRLAQVLDQLRSRAVRSLFAEQRPAAKSLQRISALSGVPIAPRPLLADSGGDNLIATLTANTCLIVEQLGGRCDHQGQAALVQQWNAIP
jgi:ABC-type Zn uptake system ZnuABC Zn-binding protein ZnuA